MKKLNKIIRMASDGFTIIEAIVMMTLIGYVVMFCFSMYFVFNIFGKNI